MQADQTALRANRASLFQPSSNPVRNSLQTSNVRGSVDLNDCMWGAFQPCVCIAATGTDSFRDVGEIPLFNVGPSIKVVADPVQRTGFPFALTVKDPCVPRQYRLN